MTYKETGDQVPPTQPSDPVIKCVKNGKANSGGPLAIHLGMMTVQSTSRLSETHIHLTSVNTIHAVTYEKTGDPVPPLSRQTLSSSLKVEAL